MSGFCRLFVVWGNIAKGCGRSTSKDFRSFLYNALGSLREVEIQILFARDFNSGARNFHAFRLDVRLL